MSNCVQRTIELRDRCHQLLDSGGKGAAEEFFNLQEKHRLVFGNRPICSVLRPHFLPYPWYEYSCQAAALVRSALGKVYDFLMLQPKLRELIGLGRREEILLSLAPWSGPGDASGRLDAFLCPPESEEQQPALHFIEYNAESPGGLAYGDALTSIFAQFSTLQPVLSSPMLMTFQNRQLILQQLLLAWERSGGRSTPNIAIVDWAEVPTYREFELCLSFFQEAGVRTSIVDPRDLQLDRHGNLFAHGEKIDVVYKRVVTLELLERMGIDCPLIEAVRQKTVVMANSFHPVLLYNKALLSFLFDDRWPIRLSKEERTAVTRHIPWTAFLEKRQLAWTDGTLVDLFELALKWQSDLVLKPVADYGGRGVLLGWQCRPDDWHRALCSALQMPSVLQRRVALPRELFPVFDGQSITLNEYFIDLDPYVWDGASIAGAGVRLSRDSLLNVSAGGGSAVPLFVVR